MKKSQANSNKDYFGIIIIGILGIVLFCIVAIINYIEDNYDLSMYLASFNVAIFILLPCYYWICDRREKRITKRIEEETIIKGIDFQYYRDIIKEYSPTTLSFILDGLEIRKDFIASVIYLINKGYFELTEDKKVRRTNKSSEGLPKDLKFLCDNNEDMIYIGTTKLSEYMKMSDKIQEKSCSLRNQWYKLVEQEAIENNLITKRPMGKFGKISIFLIVVCILEAIYALTLEKYGLFTFSIILVIAISFMTFFAGDKNKWVKTQKGYDIYTKVIGLKNYIKDYSMLSKREIEEIDIWEDYLIYAIVLNNVSKLNKNALELYKTVCDMYLQNN